MDNIRIVRGISKKNHVPETTLDTIAKTVAKYYGFTLEEIKASTKQRHVVEPRKIAIYFMCKIKNLSFLRIAKYFGFKEHTSARNSMLTVCNLYESDKDYAADVDQLNELITAILQEQ